MPPTAAQNWPLHIAKYGTPPEFYAYFENGAIRMIGGTERTDLMAGMGITDNDIEVMSAASWALAKQVSQNLFGVPTP